MQELSAVERKTVAEIAAFEGCVTLAEYEYDRTISSILKMCEKALKHKDKKMLKELAGVSGAWLKYYQATGKYISAATQKKTPEAKRTLAFIDEQVKFFKTLSKELEQEAKSIK